MKKAVRMSIMILGFIALSLSAQAAQAETITFGTSERMYAPNCHCKADVSPYKLATWCGAKTSCDGDTDTHAINLSAGNYDVKVNLAGLTDSQKYEVVVLNINGKEYTIPDQGGNSSSTGTATYNLGKMYFSGTVTVRAYHKYANTFTGKWYADESSRIGSASALESVYITAITFNKIAEPKPTCSISANPTTINSGGTSTLSWSSANATSASINQNIGSVATGGTKSVKPATSTTYTMTVSGAGGTATCSAGVTVNIPVPKPTCSISANPTTINSGGTSTLSWSSANATSASINQNIGSVATGGTKSVKPATSTTYTMTVSGAGGTATCSAGVTVN
ncbi:MAG: hypothetical protein RBR98_02010, partial [Candidatus Moranbacteria bacterium]|nr:hypothetical protein [Candidatus Moranbacteria bacterium]